MNIENKPTITGEGLKQATVKLADQFIPRKMDIKGAVAIAVTDAFTITSFLAAPILLPLNVLFSIWSRFLVRQVLK